MLPRLRRGRCAADSDRESGFRLPSKTPYSHIMFYDGKTAPEGCSFVPPYAIVAFARHAAFGSPHEFRMARPWDGRIGRRENMKANHSFVCFARPWVGLCLSAPVSSISEAVLALSMKRTLEMLMQQGKTGLPLFVLGSWAYSVLRHRLSDGWSVQRQIPEKIPL